ncbi:formylglycine-generating enzyme family protein [Streptodolium elevatio]|uniref:Formylglycine-generating enzyme family protein n=1 Tax=Streptodolium elevatio TaxID=3157996 RepID=A0ABV3DDD2_9ACTN
MALPPRLGGLGIMADMTPSTADADTPIAVPVAPPAPGPRAVPKGMAWIPGGTFAMGSDAFYPEERPVHPVTVDGFLADVHPVTVAAFRRFVKATGYVTVAERPLDPALYPDADPALLVPGSLVFRKTTGPVPLDDYRRWWHYVPGANWRHPEGPGSTLDGRDRHPVTQVAYADALAYAHWADKDLPTEAEWEYAARGGLDGAVYSWGDDFLPGSRRMANTWHGDFPWRVDTPTGRPGTTPVGRYPSNGFGLYDMAGNVWEWTSDHHTVRHPDAAAGSCCIPRNPRVEHRQDSAAAGFARRTIKGGSHLCAPEYCLRYRPAARQGETEDTATGHLGFRCVRRR